MAEPTDMNDILSDAPPPKEEPVVETPAEPDKEAAEEGRREEYKSKRQRARDKESEAQGKVRDPNTGQFVAPEKVQTEEKPAEPKVEAKPAEPAKPVQEELTPKERAAFAKAADETRKRQALEARLRELEAKQAATPAEPPKQFWDAPDEALKRNQDQTVQRAVQQAVLTTTLRTSEAIARSRYKDFDEKVAIFGQLAERTPGLAQQMASAPDPAEYVYRTAANHKALQDAGGVDQMRAKIEEETRIKVRAEIEAELKAKAAAMEKERAALPGSLSEAQSKGSNRVVWNGPTAMDDILGSK